MRIISGEFGGRKLKVSRDAKLRPSSERLREGLFSALGSMGITDAVQVLDLFAGTGSLGIEALSRGAAKCVFIEKDEDLVETLSANLQLLNLTSRTQVVRGSAYDLPARLGKVSGGRFDLVFADAPYFEPDYLQLFKQIAQTLLPDAVVVIECHEKEVATVEKAASGAESYSLLKTKEYGDSALLFFKKTNSLPIASS